MITGTDHEQGCKQMLKRKIITGNMCILVYKSVSTISSLLMENLNKNTAEE